MKTVSGDLIQLALEGKFDVIIHDCNCFCTMGAGLAGGDWEIISQIIEEELEGEDHVFVEFKEYKTFS